MHAPVSCATRQQPPWCQTPWHAGQACPLPARPGPAPSLRLTVPVRLVHGMQRSRPAGTAAAAGGAAPRPACPQALSRELTVPETVYRRLPCAARATSAQHARQCTSVQSAGSGAAPRPACPRAPVTRQHLGLSAGPCAWPALPALPAPPGAPAPPAGTHATPSARLLREACPDLAREQAAQLSCWARLRLACAARATWRPSSSCRQGVVRFLGRCLVTCTVPPGTRGAVAASTLILQVEALAPACAWRAQPGPPGAPAPPAGCLLTSWQTTGVLQL